MWDEHIRCAEASNTCGPGCNEMVDPCHQSTSLFGLFFFSLVCFVAASSHCLDSLFVCFFKRGTSWETHVHIRETFFYIVFCSYCDPSIHNNAYSWITWWDRIYFSVSGVKVEDGSEFGDGGARREVYLRGNRVMMRIPCACSLRGLSVGSVLEYEESEQALNLTVTLKVLKQQPF